MTAVRRQPTSVLTANQRQSNRDLGSCTDLMVISTVTRQPVEVDEQTPALTELLVCTEGNDFAFQKQNHPQYSLHMNSESVYFRQIPKEFLF